MQILKSSLFLKRSLLCLNASKLFKRNELITISLQRFSVENEEKPPPISRLNLKNQKIGFNENFDDFNLKSKPTNRNDADSTLPLVTTEYVLTKERFLEQCQLLKNGFLMTPKKLAHFPINAVYFGVESYFIGEILPFWWPEFKLCLYDVYTSDCIKFAMYGLLKIWKKFGQSSVITTINVDDLLLLIKSIAQSPDMISPQNYDIFMQSVVAFSESFKNDVEKMDELRKLLSESFEKFFLEFHAKFQYRFSTVHELLNRICMCLVSVEISRPSNVVIPLLVKSFFKEFEYQPRGGAVNYIFKLCRTCHVMLAWNVDCSPYESTFWTKWFSKTFELYPTLPPKAGYLNWGCLFYALLAAIKFDQEEEFLKIKEIWFDSIKRYKSIMPDNEKMQLLTNLRAKYNANPSKIGPIVLSEILRALE